LLEGDVAIVLISKFDLVMVVVGFWKMDE